MNRRNVLAAAGGAVLAAGALALPADADESRNAADTLYSHGMVWNRALPGVAGDLKLTFDLRVNLQASEGIGTAEDPIHPDWNIHFSINSIVSEKRPKGEIRHTMKGVVTNANNPAMIGKSVAIIAETAGDMTA